ncbi:MAG TPA: hypothetical protein VFY16_05765 [Gemmatimonadaceae bacterium]|nr:hypothetical protein [Gemmatimonadaceae bacterium]
MSNWFGDLWRAARERGAPDARPVRIMMRGIPTVVVNTRPDIDTADVLRRLDEALGVLETHVPWHFRRLPRDFSRLEVRRYPCRGAYLPAERACLVELTFVVNRDFTASQVASTILHEAMHARLHRLGFPLEMADRARQERFCRRAEIELGERVPDGAPILTRARASLALEDEGVAPAIDWDVAARRVREVDEGA